MRAALVISARRLLINQYSRRLWLEKKSALETVATAIDLFGRIFVKLLPLFCSIPPKTFPFPENSGLLRLSFRGTRLMIALQIIDSHRHRDRRRRRRRLAPKRPLSSLEWTESRFARARSRFMMTRRSSGQR